MSVSLLTGLISADSFFTLSSHQPASTQVQPLKTPHHTRHYLALRAASPPVLWWVVHSASGCRNAAARTLNTTTRPLSRHHHCRPGQIPVCSSRLQRPPQWWLQLFLPNRWNTAATQVRHRPQKVFTYIRYSDVIMLPSNRIKWPVFSLWSSCCFHFRASSTNRPRRGHVSINNTWTQRTQRCRRSDAGARMCRTCVTRAAHFPLSVFKGDFCNHAAQRSILLDTISPPTQSRQRASPAAFCTFTESNIQSGHHSPSSGNDHIWALLWCVTWNVLSTGLKIKTQ